MYMLNMVIILIVMYCNVVTAIDKIPTYLLRFNKVHIRVVIPDVDNSTMASLAHIAAPVIQRVFSLREY